MKVSAVRLSVFGGLLAAVLVSFLWFSPGEQQLPTAPATATIEAPATVPPTATPTATATATAVPTETPTPTATPTATPQPLVLAPYSLDAGVEQWRPIVEAYFGTATAQSVLWIMRCESGGNPHAVGGAGERGLMQIHPVNAALWVNGFDPDRNIYAAFVLSSGGTNWSPWDGPTPGRGSAWAQGAPCDWQPGVPWAMEATVAPTATPTLVPPTPTPTAIPYWCYYNRDRCPALTTEN